MIGQGRILASPLAMAGVAATVQSGTLAPAPPDRRRSPRSGEPLAPENAKSCGR